MDTNLNNEKSPAELVEMIDKLMREGNNTVNVKTSEDGSCKVDGLRVDTFNTSDCGIKGACCQPTELLEELAD
jgi:hypothetical protein